MSRTAAISLRGIFTLFSFVAGFALPTAASADIRVSETYGKLPLHFEANQGQAHKDVRFLARGPGYSLYLTADEAVLVLSRPNPAEKQDGRSTPGRRVAPAQTMPVAVRMGLVGAAPAPLVSGLEELPGKTNYFIGNDPAKWRTNVPTFAKVRYQEVYPGIDLVYYGNQRQLEYDFVIAPGADPKKIALRFKGADRLEVDANGDLVLHVAKETLRLRKPAIYQDIDGTRREVTGNYVLKDRNRIGFHVAAYDVRRPLVIDPVLAYSTFLGGNGFDGARGMAVDQAGNAYVTGYTTSTNFPTTLGAFAPAFHGVSGGLSDAFVTKLNPGGSALVYSTYLGGSNLDEGTRIAVDAEGNAYATGLTHSTDFPITAGAFQSATDGSGDAYVTKLDPTGSGLVYSTYLGGSGHEGGADIAADGLGNAYVTGSTNSQNFPITPGAFQPVFAGGSSGFNAPGPSDAFVTKLNSSGTAIDYSTYLGGSGDDFGMGIAVDHSGSAYVTGRTDSLAFPTTPGAFQSVVPPFSGQSSYNAFVTKFQPSGLALAYSTYLGGSGADGANAIAVNTDGNAYVTGVTTSLNFPVTAVALQPVIRGVSDIFVTKFHSSGSALVYSTYLGGSVADSGSGIAVDAGGNAFVTGITNSLDFPTTPGATQPGFAGGTDDAYIAALDSSGARLVFSSYLGGRYSDWGSAIALDPVGNVYVAGITRSPDFPTANAFQPAHGGGPPLFSEDSLTDGFVVKIAGIPGGSPGPTTRHEENAATYVGYWPSYGAETGTFSGGTIVASNQAAATATFDFIGTAVNWIGVRCNVCGIATVQIDGGAPTTVNTNGPGVSGNLTSEIVYSASGLAPGVTHTLVITVTGAQTGVPGWPTGNGHIAVDAFDVSN